MLAESLMLLFNLHLNKKVMNNIHRIACPTRKNHLVCYQNKDWCGSLQIPPQTIPYSGEKKFTENIVFSGSTSLSKQINVVEK